MKIKNLVLVLFIILSAPTFAMQEQQQKSRERLAKLLHERSEKFDQYLVNLEKRSGFFGNQTKKDLKRVNEKLIEIVKTDNTIFKELKRLLDYKSFERTTAVQDLSQYENLLNQNLKAIDTLNKQLVVIKNQKAEIENQSIQRIILIWVLAIFLLITLYLLFKSRRRSLASET